MDKLPVPNTKTGWLVALVLIALSYLGYYACNGYTYIQQKYNATLWKPLFYEDGNIRVQMRIPRYLSSFVPREVVVTIYNAGDISLPPDTWVILTGAYSEEESCPRPDETHPLVHFCAYTPSTASSCSDTRSYFQVEEIPSGGNRSYTLWVTADLPNETDTGSSDEKNMTHFGLRRKSKTGCMDPRGNNSASILGAKESFFHSLIGTLLLPPWSNGFLPALALFATFLAEERWLIVCTDLRERMLSVFLFIVSYLSGVVVLSALLLFATLPTTVNSKELWVGIPSVFFFVALLWLMWKVKCPPTPRTDSNLQMDRKVHGVLVNSRAIRKNTSTLLKSLQNSTKVQQAIAEAMRDIHTTLENGVFAAGKGGIVNNGETEAALLVQQALALPWSTSQLIDTEEIAAWYREALSHLSREAFQQLLIADTRGTFTSHMLTLLSKMLVDVERDPKGKYHLRLSDGDFGDSLTVSPIWAIRETGRPNFLEKWHSDMKDFPEHREALYRWLFERKAGWAEEHFFTVILPAVGDSHQERIASLDIYIKHMQESGRWVEIPWESILAYLMNTIDKSTHIPKEAWNVLKPGGTQGKFLWEVVEEKTPFVPEKARELHKWLQDILCIVPIPFFEPIAERIFTYLEDYKLTDDEAFKEFADAYRGFKQSDGAINELHKTWCVDKAQWQEE